MSLATIVGLATIDPASPASSTLKGQDSVNNEIPLWIRAEPAASTILKVVCGFQGRQVFRLLDMRYANESYSQATVDAFTFERCMSDDSFARDIANMLGGSIECRKLSSPD